MGGSFIYFIVDLTCFLNIIILYRLSVFFNNTDKREKREKFIINSYLLNKKANKQKTSFFKKILK